MKLRRKISKLFTGEGMASLNRHLGRALLRSRFPLDKERILETIDRDKFAQIRRRYSTDPAAQRWSKYLELDRWIEINLCRIQRTGLDTRQRQRVLDLGCGAGYFIYTAKLLGHDALGLDTEDQPMFGEITSLLGVERIVWRIEAFIPLPNLNKKFDLVTGYRVVFNNHKRPDLWRAREWEFFLNDLAQYLAPGGRVWLELNLEQDGTFYTPELESFFISRNAKIKGSRIFFRA